MVGVKLRYSLLCVQLVVTRWVLSTLSHEDGAGSPVGSCPNRTLLETTKPMGESVPRDITGGVTSNKQCCVPTVTRESGHESGAEWRCNWRTVV